MCDLSTSNKNPLSEQTKEALKTSHFDIWKWQPNEMVLLLEEMYFNLGLVDEFAIHPQTLRTFLTQVQENYRNNPFHNFRHGFCVTQMMYVFIHQLNLMAILSKKDLCVLITSCICHDLDHPGLNNAYQINAQTELAIRYKDCSPLENHHCAISFSILASPECNIFENCSPEEFNQIRNDMRILILATDMTHHAGIVDSFRQQLCRFDFQCEEHLKTLKMVLIKASDMSNECRPLASSEPWVRRLLLEYFHQSDVEKQYGLPTDPFMDRDRVTESSVQVGFIKFVILPLFESINKLFPQMEEVALKNLRTSLSYYEKKRDKDDSDKIINRITLPNRPDPVMSPMM